MRLVPTPLAGVLVLEPTVYRDDRGTFVELFRDDRLADLDPALGLPTTFRQWNRSRSTAGVLRGLHYQRARPQGKLISVTQGAVYDVAVDVRRGSPTFGRWAGVTLDAESGRQLWIPAGFAHGFCVLGDEAADVVYACTDRYDPTSESGVAWDDPMLAIEWPVSAPRVSARDAQLPYLTDDRDDLPRYDDAGAAAAASR